MNQTAARNGTSVLQKAPGSATQAAAQVYYERGSMQSVELSHWKVISGILGIAVCLCGLAFWQLIPLKTVEVVAVSRADGGRLVADSTDRDFRPDQEMTAYFLSDWVTALVEISAPAWRKNVEKAGRMSVSVAKDQLKEFLNRDENNAASIIIANNGFVRTYESVSINFIKADVALIRFRTLTRRREGEKPAVQTFALTANFGQVKPSTRFEALQNPAGLYVTSFNVAEETSQR